MVNIGELLWILDSATGTPQSIYDYANGYGVETSTGVTFSAKAPFVATNADGRFAYIASAGYPALLLLDDIDNGTRLFEPDYRPPTGPRVLYNKGSRGELPDSGSYFGGWVNPAPTIAMDGTLVWKNADGKVKATAPDGTDRWARKIAAGGWGMMDSAGTTYLAMGAPVALRLSDGEALWQATLPDTDGFAESLERQGAGAFNYWTLLWDSSSDSHVSYLTSQNLADGSLRWSRKLVFPEATGSWAHAIAAQSSDGTLYLSSEGFEMEGIVRGLDGNTGATLWQTTIPAAEGFESRLGADYHGSLVMGGPIGSRKSRAVYVASSNCKVYGLNWAGEVEWWYRMAGGALSQTHQLVDGVLYVLAAAPDGLAAGQEVCPTDDPALATGRYGCPYASPGTCNFCVSASHGIVFYLYAFKVE